jgi:23S rRNA (adenine2503-C2)-methyltransferase
MNTRRNLFGLSVADLAETLSPFGARPFAARQLAAQLYARRARSFEEMTDLPAALRRELSGSFSIDYPRIIERRVSSDGTTAYVLALPAGGRVESVFIPARGRVALCISSQAGCALGCSFCMTATLGLQRHLSPGEIAGQVALLVDRHRLETNRYNIVMMGMGEPLHNYDSVLAALRLLCGGRTGFGISPRHVTLSTVGLAPEIERLAEETAAPRLAVSLNATTDAVRSRIMPINRTYPIARLMKACRTYVRRQRQRLTLEYVLLSGINDRESDLPRLARFARSLPARVNLIPFNPVPLLPFEGSPMTRVRQFRDGLLERGARASIRASRGGDVLAACGQLAFGEGSRTQ